MSAEKERSTTPAAPAEQGTVPSPSLDARESAPRPTNGAALDDVETLRQELATAKDQALRAAAELDNVRKRTRRELDQERRYTHLGLLRELLPVLDNLARAAQAAEGGSEAAGLLAGVKLVEQQLASLLERHHCRRIATVGAAFDPHLHEAISLAPAAGQPPGTVLQEVQSGYLLHDRVVRPAQVIVAAAPATETPVEANNQGA